MSDPDRFESSSSRPTLVRHPERRRPDWCALRGLAAFQIAAFTLFAVGFLLDAGAAPAADQPCARLVFESFCLLTAFAFDAAGAAVAGYLVTRPTTLERLVGVAKLLWCTIWMLYSIAALSHVS